MRVASQTPIDAGVALLPTVDDAEEKEIATWKHNPMAVAAALVAVAVRADDELAVAVPFDRRRRNAVS